MTEWKLFTDDVAYVSTFEFHEHRERAPHMEQPAHRPRLDRACEFIYDALSRWSGAITYDVDVVDLGCGDGGMVQRLRASAVDAWGCDFQPSNVDGWFERGVRDHCEPISFVKDWDLVPYARVYSITECLEHLTEPHTAVARIRNRDAWMVASSPWNEHPGSHDACHAWAWDVEGYARLLRDFDFEVVRHEQVNQFQVIMGRPV